MNCTWRSTPSWIQRQYYEESVLRDWVASRLTGGCVVTAVSGISAILSHTDNIADQCAPLGFTHKGIPMDRQALAEKIAALKHKKQISWRQLADAVGGAPGFATAALLGQMSLAKDEAETIGRLLSLNEDEITLLQRTAYRGSLPTAIPTDPLIYRFYEITQVFGTTLKALIEEEFGDGIMSAIDFELSVERILDPKGDRVKVTFNGKFLPYREY